jgi:hypothetical protein
MQISNNSWNHAFSGVTFHTVRSFGARKTKDSPVVDIRSSLKCHLFGKATFSLIQRWPLNRGLTIYNQIWILVRNNCSSVLSERGKQKTCSGYQVLEDRTLSGTPQWHSYLITIKNMFFLQYIYPCTVFLPAHPWTSIKQSPVLRGHLFIVLS